MRPNSAIHIRPRVMTILEAEKICEEYPDMMHHVLDRGLYMGMLLMMHDKEHTCFICQQIKDVINNELF